MPTLYSEIDNMFLADIKDDTFLDYTNEDRQEILDGLRIKAITRFKACIKDLTDRTEASGEIEGQFNQTLTEEEKLIIATIMRKYWLNDKIYNLELLQQRMTTKDWKLTSQANHLENLVSLKKELDIEISRMIVEYSLYTYNVGDSQ